MHFQYLHHLYHKDKEYCLEIILFLYFIHYPAERNCKSSSHGKNYMGYSNQSIVHGAVCLPWSSIYPGLSAFPIIPDPSMDSAFNYCRFVPKYDEIGCYIDGTVSFAACEIPACRK